MRCSFRLLSVVLALWCLPAAAQILLTGRVTDALTHAPLSGVRVTLDATGATAQTNRLGEYALDVPAGVLHTLRFEALGYPSVSFVRQDGRRPAVVQLLPSVVETPPDRDGRLRYGVPHHRSEALATEGGAIRLDGSDPAWPRPIHFAAPTVLPATIRIGRRFASSCTGNPVQQIDELDFEDYVAGVVQAEIGVFRAASTGEESARASFETFTVLARTYALWWYLRSGATAAYHLDDTACNQRYDDARNAFIVAIVNDTAGQVMVSAADPTVLDKYEYAASCGRNGTRPEYQSTLVPDQTSVVGCTNGGWCGHDNCAGHEDNPSLPAGNRCLVRGTCQWGSLEWSIEGQSYTWILQHYEPNLTLIGLGGPALGNLVGFVRDSDIFTGADIEGATVTLSTGATVTTAADGLFRFDGLPYATYTLTASAPGYLASTRMREVSIPGDSWASIALLPDLTPDGGIADSGGDDAGVGGDAGGPGGGGPPVAGGCGCQGAPGSAGGWLALFSVLALHRVRRRIARVPARGW